MSDEQKPTANVEAEKDVRDVLAELKGENTKPEGATKEDDEARIVAEAAKLGEKSEKSQEKPHQRDGGRPRRNMNNARFDPSTLEETDDPVQIRKQVEFYFSDSNLFSDKFLMGLVDGAKNNAVPLETIHSFKRMKRFQPFSAVVEALKTSETLELTDNDTAVKRKVPLPENNDDSIKVFENKAMARSIYAKGFGREEGSTQYDIEAFFAPYGPINAIRLRRGDDKGFKGSVFVEFATEEKQKEFLDLPEKPKWKGKDLIIKSKKQYCDEKVEEIKSGNVKPSRGRGGGRGRGRGGRGGRGNHRNNDRGDRNDNRDWRERRADDQKNGFKDDKAEAKKDERGVPVVESTADAGQKRPREEEANGDHPAKKVDAKE
ncbi:hypothetical protein N7468_002246 [Penicillium chermesinum]|uniref:Uncharacterized protein n=1 Tax=Penicillium chermesinum TaxID=63820 RepID=A0A9W9PI52_9EURO|nr:uncharacterized protein N7468_002246 [Penicillium chermesinum]KAJ5247263.1 hypothetical protein N7468_002246 [Penicillium chermesinum]KAJ6145505.1 hypothetical protein N7470_009400 [Penicillium chermesinum]